MMNREYIKSLLEKYFDGLTSLKEEENLRRYFQEENIPAEFEAYKPIFQYFTKESSLSALPASEAKQAHPDKRLWFGIAAAACLVLFFGLRLAFHSPYKLTASSTIYIDGKKHTDIELIQAEALKALENFSGNNSDIYSSQIEALNFFFDNN